MKVYLIKTPEYDSENFREVFDLLTSFGRALEFSPSSYEFTSTDFEFLGYSYFKNEDGVKKLLFEITMQKPLAWEELFSMCRFYRKQFGVLEDDFVVLLTARRNEPNWFSHNDSEKNIFIHTGDWNNYIKLHHKYPVAYQVLENIMQSLMKVTSESFPSPYIHKIPKGCMNDFCEEKQQVILKLQTANICSDCAEKIQEENIDQNIVEQVLETFEGIRNEFLFKQKRSSQASPVPIIINERKQILLPQLNNLEIRLTPLYKSLYIFFLKHTDGVKLKDLSDFKDELLFLYKSLTVSDDKEKIEASINALVSSVGTYFNQTKTKINKVVDDLLGEPLASFYRIEGKRGEQFKINIPNNLIDIRY